MKSASPPRRGSALPWFLVVALAAALAVAVSQLVTLRSDGDKTAVASAAAPAPAERSPGVARTEVARPPAPTPASPRADGGHGNAGPPQTLGGAADTRTPPRPPSGLPSERFDAAPATDTGATAARFKPWLDGVFQGSSADYAVECRGPVCKLEVLLDDLPDKDAHFKAVNDLMKKLQHSKDICGWQFGPSTPGKEPVSGRAIETMHTFFEACDETRPDAGETLGQIFAQLETSGAVADCRRQNPERGRLVVQLEARSEDGNGKVLLYVGGELAGTGAGKCLEARLRQLADAVSVPEGSSGATIRRDIVL